MNKAKLTVASLGLLFVSGMANATVYSNLSNYITTDSSNPIVQDVSKGSFTDYYSFTYSGSNTAYDVSNVLTTYVWRGATITLTDITGLVSSIVDSSYNSVTSLVTGQTYDLKITGTATGSVGGAYVITAAVPEPETYALMGVGLLGLLAVRRKHLAKVS